MRSRTAAWRPGSDPALGTGGGAVSGRVETRKFRLGVAAPLDAEPALAEGVIVGDRYRVESLIGEGGMGRVYRARHVFLDRPVALKVLRRDARTDPDSVQRFQREALAASKVGHDAIVQVSDFAKMTDGQVFLAMELLEGESLEAFIDRPATLDIALGYLQQVAEGLAAAHAAGVIHRDIKPANVFLASEPGSGSRPGEVQAKILDFGIAKMATEHVGGYTTSNGAVLGTPYYLAPERARGDEPDPRADIYSLGVILYEVLTGTLPFVADSFMAILGHHMRTPPVDPRLAAPDRPIPDQVAELCMAMLEKRPEDRPADAGEVARALAATRRRDHASLSAVPTGPRSGVAAADANTQALNLGGMGTSGDGADTAVLAVRSSNRTAGPERPHGSRRIVVAVVAAALVAGAAAGLVVFELRGDDVSGQGAATGAGTEATLDPEASRNAPAPASSPEGEGGEATASRGPAAAASEARSSDPTSGGDAGAPQRVASETGDDDGTNDPVPSSSTAEAEPRKKRTKDRTREPTADTPTPPGAPEERPTKADGKTPPELKDDIYGD